jgi:hypothetical protein
MENVENTAVIVEVKKRGRKTTPEGMKDVYIRISRETYNGLLAVTGGKTESEKLAEMNQLVAGGMPLTEASRQVARDGKATRTVAEVLQSYLESPAGLKAIVKAQG